MDLQEKHQIDLTGSVAKVKERARPWRAIIALVLAIASAAVAGWANHVLNTDPHERQLAHSLLGPHKTTYEIIKYAGTAAFCVFGVGATFGLADKARAGLQPRIGSAHAGVLRYALVLLGLFLIAVVAFSVAGGSSSVRQLLIGGAVTGVLLGIAAQQSLANLFAGMVLLFARPFRVGDHVRIRSGALGGMLEGIVSDISLTYVRLETDNGRCLLPNSQVLAAVVGPGAALAQGTITPGPGPAAASQPGPVPAAASQPDPATSAAAIQAGSAPGHRTDQP